MLLKSSHDPVLVGFNLHFGNPWYNLLLNSNNGLQQRKTSLLCGGLFFFPCSKTRAEPSSLKTHPVSSVVRIRIRMYIRMTGEFEGCPLGNVNKLTAFSESLFFLSDVFKILLPVHVCKSLLHKSNIKVVPDIHSLSCTFMSLYKISNLLRIVYALFNYVFPDSKCP